MEKLGNPVVQHNTETVSAEAVNTFLSGVDLRSMILPVLPEEISSNGEGGFYIHRTVHDVRVTIQVGRESAWHLSAIDGLINGSKPNNEGVTMEKEKKLRPLGNFVVVQRDKSESKSQGGILIPDAAQEPLATGTVLAVGRGRVLDSGRIEEPEAKVGDRVAFNRFAGQAVPGRKDEIVLTGHELLGVFE